MNKMQQLFQKKAPPRVDPDNVRADLSMSDFRIDPVPLSQDAEAKVTMVGECFQEASQARYHQEGEWMTALAFYEGNQWVEWKQVDGVTGLHDLRDRSAPYRDYTTINKIFPKIMKLEALAMQNKIDASVAPLTPLPRDRDAAAEARAVLAHRDREDDWQAQQHELIEGALVLSSSYLKLYWDKDKVVPVPVLGPDGQMSDLVDAPVGEVCSDVVLGLEIYLPPGTKKFKDAPWLIHAQVRPLSYVQNKYGRFDVDGDADGGSFSTLENRVAGIVGEGGPGTYPRGRKTAVTIKEYWEKPNAVYPKGRYLVVAGGRLLVDTDWPYDKSDTFPFVQLCYRRGIYSAYGKGAVAPLVALQRSYNRSVSRVQEHVKSGDGKILLPRGCEIGADAFKSGRRNEIIYYSLTPEIIAHGGRPEYLPPPPIDPLVLENIRLMGSDLDDLTMHEVSEGNVPSGVTAAAAINLLQESDNRAIANFIGAIETLNVERARWIIALAAQFYTQPRLVFVQDDAQAAPILPIPNPAQMAPMGQMPIPMGQPPLPMGQPPMPNANLPAQMQAQTFQNLANGRVVVSASSATPKSAAARNQEILDMAQHGLFSPQQLPVLKMILPLMDLEQSDRLRAEIEDLMQKNEAQQPNPAVLAQMQMQHAAQVQSTQQQAQQEHDAQMLAIQQQHEQAKMQLQLSHEAQLQAIRAHGTVQVEQRKHQMEMAVNDQTFRHQMALRGGNAEQEPILPSPPQSLNSGGR